MVDEQLDVTDVEGDIDIQRTQQEDQLLNAWIHHVKNGVKPSKKVVPSTADHRAMLRNFQRLKIIDAILVRKVDISGDTRIRVVHHLT